MRPPVRVRVRGRQLNQLREMYHQTRCARTRLHAQIVLLSAAGHTIAEIAEITRQSDETVRRWLQRFQAEGCAGLAEWPHSGRLPEITAGIEKFLWEAAQQSPRDFGYHRPSWTTALLAKLVKRQFKVTVSAECIRQHLERIDIVCRRPTWTVKHKAREKVGYAQRALTRLLRRPPMGADVYVQDEAEMSLFPTLTRMWMVKGRQKKIRAPGVHPPKRHECAATDWHDCTNSFRAERCSSFLSLG